MSQEQPAVDTEKIHRWFAVESNNLAWDLLENKRTPEQDIELLHVAHASAHHWAMGGDVVNRARAECVVANAHAALGDGSAALRHAKLCRQLNKASGDKCRRQTGIRCLVRDLSRTFLCYSELGMSQICFPWFSRLRISLLPPNPVKNSLVQIRPVAVSMTVTKCMEFEAEEVIRNLPFSGVTAFSLSIQLSSFV